MKPRITVLTIGVDDLDRSLAFYRDGLGLPTQGIIGQEFEHGAVAFFDLQAGLKLAIWNRKDTTTIGRVATRRSWQKHSYRTFAALLFQQNCGFARVW